MRDHVSGAWDWQWGVLDQHEQQRPWNPWMWGHHQDLTPWSCEATTRIHNGEPFRKLEDQRQIQNNAQWKCILGGGGSLGALQQEPEHCAIGDQDVMHDRMNVPLVNWDLPCQVPGHLRWRTRHQPRSTQSNPKQDDEWQAYGKKG